MITPNSKIENIGKMFLGKPAYNPTLNLAELKFYNKELTSDDVKNIYSEDITILGISSATGKLKRSHLRNNIT